MELTDKLQWLSITALVIANLLKSYRLYKVEESATSLWHCMGVVSRAARDLVAVAREEPTK